MGRLQYKRRARAHGGPHGIEAACRAQRAGDWAETEVICRSLLDTQPDYPEALLLAAGAALELGRPTESEELLARGIAAHPRDARLHSQMGTTLRALGRREAASASYRRALDLEPRDANHYSNLGNMLLDLGRQEEAAANYRRGLQLEPGHAVLHNNLAAALREQGRRAEAISSFRRAVELQPDFPDALQNLANALREAGAAGEAAACYEKLLQLKPDLVSAHLNLGVALQNDGKLDEAACAYEKVLELQPDSAGACNNLGNLRRLQGKLDQARPWLQKAVELDPLLVVAHNNLGSLLQAQEETDRALAEFERAIELAPADPVGYNNAGNIFAAREEFDKAEQHLRKALEIEPDFAQAHNNLGNVVRSFNRFDEAVDCYRRAVELDPTFADAHSNLGNGWKDLGMFQEAVAAYGRALELSPDADGYRWNRALAALSAGDLEHGWVDYESGFGCKQRAPERIFPQPRWVGESLTGRTILTWGEQGVGDEIMFANAIPDLAARADSCVVECDPRLVPLFARSFPDCEILPRSTPPQPRTAWPDIDCQSPMGSLPRWLRPSVASFPHDRGYLKADPDRVAYWRERLADLGPAMKVGISWRSRVMTANRIKLCVPLDQWAPILQTPGVQFINLQYCNWEDDVAEAEKRLGVRVHHFQNLDLKDALDDVAALVAALDLTITISNICMTIGGGLNVPTWVFGLRDHMDWLTLGVESAPWFPSVRLFYRTWRESWEPVVRGMAEELKGLAGR